MSTLTHPTAFEYYYYGLVGPEGGQSMPKLLARSNPAPWAIPLLEPASGYDAGPCPDTKAVFVVTHHPLSEKLDQGLRHKIIGLLSIMRPPRWISVDYVRIGYDKEVPRHNPVVVFITVEEGQMSRSEAQKVVDAISEECKKVDLHDVEVEIKEGRRSTASSSDDESLPLPTQYPFIGASISTSQSRSRVTGTLAGYVVVDGEVMGLTSHHVAFGKDRLEAFPTMEEEANGTTYTFRQPALSDLHGRIEQLEHERSVNRDQDAALDAELKELQLWTPENGVLGKAWRSSGVRARNGAENRRFRLDWALIKLSSERFSEQAKIVNEIPSYKHQQTQSLKYCKDAMSAVGNMTMREMPRYLK